MVIAIMLINIILTATPMKNVAFCLHTHATHLNQKTGGGGAPNIKAEPQQQELMELYTREHTEEES